MWLAAACLTGMGIWKLRNSLKLLHLAGLNMFVSEFETIGARLGELKSELSAAGQELREVEELVRQVDDNLGRVYKEGGEKGATGNIEQIWATRDIALAATFFAMAGVVMSVSAVLIAAFIG